MFVKYVHGFVCLIKNVFCSKIAFLILSCLKQHACLFLPIRRLKPSIISTDQICNHLQGTLPLHIRHCYGVFMFPSKLASIIGIKCGFIMEPQNEPPLMHTWHWLLILMLLQEILRSWLHTLPCRKKDIRLVCLNIFPFVAINILTLWI